MQAFVTSIGEPTTDLCIWSLERQGYDVKLVKGTDSLASKLEYIYHEAQDNFIRVDADIIVNRHIKELELPLNVWWLQASCFGWYSQDIIEGGIQYVGKQCLPILRDRVHECLEKERPETYMYRLAEFHNPRRCVSSEIVCGIHGWGQTDIARVKAVKQRRGQMDNYDFELAEVLNDFQTT